MSTTSAQADRELLELAAKAAGLEILGQLYTDDGKVVFKHQGGFVVCDGIRDYGWNPLTDDGDALRLAVKLDISMSPGQVKAGVTWWRRPEMIEQDGLAELHGDDPDAAIRRAIVRAAAEIGRAPSSTERGG